MIISLIVAMDKNNLIGKNNKIPWHIPGELKRFRAITMGKPIIMGRKTFESIGKPLDGRENVVLTNNKSYKQAGVKSYHNISEVISDFTNYDEIFIIGGSEIYALVLPLAHKLYVTKIDKIYDGDTWFPKIRYNEWKIQESTQITEETTQTQYENIIYTKISE
tara:strand:+ start:1097 stop:1585 length:489 start_codon:yes stop_codon:yes gene_type:complete